uniref:Methyltransferase like 21E, pseudo n=1 Tax=Podarcis muralis TaxID=64176 RepID=A0A670JBW0_PODMU
MKKEKYALAGRKLVVLQLPAKADKGSDLTEFSLANFTGKLSFILWPLPATGARVVATDLPELLGNLQYNLVKNTKTKCKHEPQAKELFWGVDLEKNFPRASCQFDYILAADVVYHHPYLNELLLTFDHLCKDNTIIIWAMRFRLEKENQFVPTKTGDGRVHYPDEWWHVSCQTRNGVTSLPQLGVSSKRQ